MRDFKILAAYHGLKTSEERILVPIGHRVITVSFREFHDDEKPFLEQLFAIIYSEGVNADR